MTLNQFLKACATFGIGAVYWDNPSDPVTLCPAHAWDEWGSERAGVIGSLGTPMAKRRPLIAIPQSQECACDACAYGIAFPVA